MANIWIGWLRDFILGLQSAGEWLTSQPFKDIEGLPAVISNITPLALIGIGGLTAFVIVAVIKWILS